MSPTRREALVELSALLAIPLVRWPERLADPLAGTIADYQAGRARRDWSAAEATKQALDRANALNGWLRAIDELSPTALDDARASDARARSGTLRGPLDGVPVFAKSIYDMTGLPTTGSSAEWAKLFPGAVGRDSLEVARMRAVGAIVLGKTAADDFAYHGNGTSSLTGQVLAVFDRAVADLQAAGALVEPCAPTVTRATVRDLFAQLAKDRGDIQPNANSPAATANALFRYFETHGGDARRDVERGLAPYRAFYDVLPKEWPEMAALIDQPYEREPAGISFARSREAAIAQLAATFRAQRIDAMIYPTMPFPAPRDVDPWPDVRTTLGYGNWMGLPEVSVPTGLGADGMPAGNISFVGLPGGDARVLALAHSYERASSRFVAPPPPPRAG